MKKLFFLLLLLSGNEIRAQQRLVPILKCSSVIPSDQFFQFAADRNPVFPGGDSSLNAYVAQHFSFDKEMLALTAGKSADVYFCIDTTGAVCNVQISWPSKAGGKIDSLLVDIFCGMPAWTPGGNGKAGVGRNMNFRLHAKVTYPSPDHAAVVTVMELPRVYLYKPSTKEDLIYSYAEEMPVFPGGEQGWIDYLKKSIVYPDAEKKAGQAGTVYVSFVIEKDGSVSNVYVSKGLKDAPGLNAEALRVVMNMPPWKPGTFLGKEVRVQVTQPIKFTL